MNKFKLFGVILASLSPLIATDSQAQLDLYTPVQSGVASFCLNNPHLRNDPNCARYYKRSPTRGTRPNASAPRPRSTSPNCDRAIANVENAINTVDTSAPSSSVSLQLQKVQQANQLMAEQCRDEE